MPVLISILACNNLSLTKAAIRSALAQTSCSPGSSLLVLDNASTDSTPQWLASQCGFSTIMLAGRTSVAACWNIVLDWALSPLNLNQYEGVLMLNNDVEIRPDTVQWLMADPAPFVTAVSVRSESELHYPDPPTEGQRRPHPDFSCFMIKPLCWRKTGRFDEGFEVAFCEDNDYHVRMHLAKVEAMCLDLPFVHRGSQTVKRADKAEARMIERAAQRNRERFLEMYGCLPGSDGYNAIFEV